MPLTATKREVKAAVEGLFKVKVTKVVFSIDGKTVKTDKSAPFKQTLTVRSLLASGYDQFYEVGPGRVLRGLLKRIERRIPCQGVFD